MDVIQPNPENTQQAVPQPVPVQPSEPFVSNPIQKPPYPKINLKKFFNISSWIFLFFFLPITVLIFLSQDSIPGNLFYPVKRSLENVILAAASVSPATRAAFRTDLTTKRFDEAEKLLLGSSGNNGLKDFVTEIQAAQNEVSAISDPIKQKELQQKVQTSIKDYEKRLDAVKVKLVAEENVNQLAIAPTSSPTSLPTNSQIVPTQIESAPILLPTSTPIPVPTSKPGQPPISTNTPAPLPTSTPKSPSPSILPIIIPSIIPTHPPVPTPTAIPQPTAVPPVVIGGGTIGALDDVTKYLNCLQNTPAPHRECIAPNIGSASPTLQNKKATQSEEKSKQGEAKKDLEKKRETTNENTQNTEKNTH